jgi:hypothetical protein
MMGHMKDFDRRIRQGGADAIAAVGELMPQWIPVGERLPKDRQRVLAYLSQFMAGDSTDVCQATFNADVGWFETQFGCYTASHWMPLPEPPEVTK